MAPTAWHRADRRRTFAPETPPSAPTRIAHAGRDRAIAFQRSGPRPGAPGWLLVAKAGERNTRSTLARTARRRSATEWAEPVTRPRHRTEPGQRAPLRCTPARSRPARRASPATTIASWRFRQMRSRSRPIASRFGAESCRKTTPARPRGSRATASRGSGSRSVSVNSHRAGNRARSPWTDVRRTAPRRIPQAAS
jgi:hypothetical protein